MVLELSEHGSGDVGSQKRRLGAVSREETLVMGGMRRSRARQARHQLNDRNRVRSGTHAIFGFERRSALASRSTQRVESLLAISWMQSRVQSHSFLACHQLNVRNVSALQGERLVRLRRSHHGSPLGVVFLGGCRFGQVGLVRLIFDVIMSPFSHEQPHK